MCCICEKTKVFRENADKTRKLMFVFDFMVEVTDA